MQPKWRWLNTWNQSRLWTLSSFLMMVMSHKKWFKENYAKQIHPFKKQESNWKTWNANILSRMSARWFIWMEDKHWRCRWGGQVCGIWLEWIPNKQREAQLYRCWVLKKKKTEDIGHTHLHIVAQYRGRILIEEKADSHKLLDTLSL